MGWLSPEPGIVELVGEHYGSLYRFAYRLCGCATDAEDLTQDTFCKAQANWAQLKDRSKSRSWLFQILRNEYLQRVRGESRNKLHGLENADSIPMPTANSAFDISSEELQAALNVLPEGFRTPIILYYFDDFSYRDIAEQLGLPLGTVMSRLSRGKVFLREQLGGAAGKATVPSEMDLS